MLYVHKKSVTPIDPWPALRHGGVNNLDAGIKGRYLVLFNVDIVQIGGLWHYIFEFDNRESLEVSALAQMVQKDHHYPDDVDWKGFLGQDFTVISPAVRAEILAMRDDGHSDARITDMREVPNARPVPTRNPGDWYRAELPENFLLSLPNH